MSKTWTVTADAESAEWRRQLARHFPLVSPHKILRLCMRFGLRSAVRRPDVLITEAECTDTETETVVPTGDETGVQS